MGTRQSTRAPRPAGAASRFVGLQTPPSTYSRPPISTGANIHGTAHEASTASATCARGAPGAPKITRRPLPRSTAATRRRPSKRAPSALEVLAEAAAACAAAAATRAQHRGAREPPARRGAGQRQRGERRRHGRAGARQPAAPARRRRRRGLAAPAAARARARPPRPTRAPLGARVGRAAGGQRRGDDRARRRPDEVLALAEVEPRRPRCRRARRASTPRRASRRRRARARRAIHARGCGGRPAEVGSVRALTAGGHDRSRMLAIRCTDATVAAERWAAAVVRDNVQA